MAHFRITFGPFVSSLALSAAMLLGASSLSAKPRSACNLLASEAECKAAQVNTVPTCSWVSPQSYTLNGKRKDYCRTKSSFTKAEFEKMQAGSSGPVANAQ